MRRILPALLIAPLMLAGCRRDPAETSTAEEEKLQPTPAFVKPKEEVPAKTVASLAHDNTAFALDLYRRFTTEKGNLVFSPYSISTALAMTYTGARGETAAQMAKTMHFTLPADNLPPAFANLNWRLYREGQKLPFQLNVANALWIQTGMPTHSAYRQVVHDSYAADLKPADFNTDAEGARQRINTWAERQTQGMVRDLLNPEDIIKGWTRVVLCNAMYFRSDWAKAFEKAATRTQRFHSPSGPIKTPLMHRLDHYRYTDNGDVQVLELPYKDNMSMIVLLPRSVDGLAALEKSLTQAKLNEWLEALRSRRVDVIFPRFKSTSRFSLVEKLKELGMVDAFSPNKADFSGVTDQESLFISQAIHQATVIVNEEGTEAAAATAVIETKKEEAPRPEPLVTFHADHPFLYLIRDGRTQTTLFMGRLNQPAAD